MLAALVDWRGLIGVVLFVVAVGVVMVAAFSFGVVGLDRWSRSRGGGAPPGDGATAEELAGVSITDAATPVGVARPMVAFGSLAMAAAGFGICVVAVLLGLWSLVER